MSKVKASKNKAKDTEPKSKIVPPQRQQPATHLQMLQFIDRCVSMASLSRNDHVQAQQALRQISGALGELEQLKKGTP